jgi:hypothetical protein
MQVAMEQLIELLNFDVFIVGQLEIMEAFATIKSILNQPSKK